MTPHPDSSGGARRPGQPGAVKGPGLVGRVPEEAGAPGDTGLKKTATGAVDRSPDEESGDEASAHAVEEDLEEVLSLARRERDEYLDMLRRVQADFENYKKRMIRQQTELLDRAAQGLLEKLLPALDAFALARAHLSDVQELSEEGKALLQGSALLFDTLGKEGLERIDDVGGVFDPTTHEAVEHQPAADSAGEHVGAPADVENGAQNGTDASGPVVTAVLRPGYRWKGRVIRPAMVRVRG